MAELRRSFDETWGGFGSAPKFPQPMTLEFVLRMALRDAPDALDDAHDDPRSDGRGRHLRPARRRLRPLLDRRGLARPPLREDALRQRAARAAVHPRLVGDPRTTAIGGSRPRPSSYLLREMRHPAGGFFSSQDADSEGVEGKFFTWSWEELVALVGEDAADRLRCLRRRATGREHGRGRTSCGDRTVREPQRATSTRPAGPCSRRGKRRVRPATDDKVLTAWNAMAIQALAEAGTGVRRRAGSSRRGRGPPRFVLANLRERRREAPPLLAEGRTRRVRRTRTTMRCSRPRCSRCSPARVELRWFREARRLVDDLVRLFADDGARGFFQIGRGRRRRSSIRPKELYDNAVPSGNSVAADVIQRIALLTGDLRARRDRASRRSASIRDVLGRAPTGVRARAVGARPLPGADPRGGDRRLGGRSGHAGARGRGPRGPVPPEHGRRRSRRPTTRGGGRGGPLAPRPPAGGRAPDRLRVRAIRVPPPRDPFGRSRRSARRAAR